MDRKVNVDFSAYAECGDLQITSTALGCSFFRFEVCHLEQSMAHTARLFVTGHSQAVCLPAAFRFDTHEVFIHKDPLTDDVILSRRPECWDRFLAAAKNLELPEDF
jgi:antitoxin VapB